MRPLLERLQNELFDLGADLSVPYDVEGADSAAPTKEGVRASPVRPSETRLRIDKPKIVALEAACDEWNASLPELRSFVLPGGSEAAARLHVARTVCRRAERDALAAAEEVELNPLALVYLNRLSDLLFILARAANAGRDEPLWKPGTTP